MRATGLWQLTALGGGLAAVIAIVVLPRVLREHRKSALTGMRSDSTARDFGSDLKRMTSELREIETRQVDISRKLAELRPQGTELPNETEVKETPEQAARMSDADRREKSKRDAARRAASLASFMNARPRDGWAMTKQDRIRELNLPVGYALTEAQCTADICRVLFTGPDDSQVFPIIESLLGEDNQAYAREVSHLGDTVMYEAFTSPKATTWPPLEESKP